MDKKIHHLREEYLLHSLDRKDLDNDPIIQFNQWFDQALSCQISDVNALCISTVNEYGRPSSRMVLLKEVLNRQFIFFTNFASRKGLELSKNGQVAALFYWSVLQRQIRIEGRVTKMSDDYSTAYFNTRPIESQAGSMVSAQSEVIESRDEIVQNMNQLLKSPELIKKPAHWGAYAIEPDYFEFWQGRANRLHDRFRYRLVENSWIIERLAP